jgi:1,4-dihydroxy-2-naphthoate octaprenyltransferase
MSFKLFLELVEIRTKLASLLPFITGLLFVIYHFGEFNPLNTAVFFTCMIIFDMTTTAINNYMDWKKAVDDPKFDYKNTRNVIGKRNIDEKIVVITILTMLVVAIVLGVWLVYLTTLVVLLIGLLCFTIGIFYTFGPIPLSRLPLGEIFSGFTMGFGIRFLIIYVNAYHLGLLGLVYNEGQLLIYMDIIELLTILLISLPGVFTIANVMLANNICDLEEDRSNNRYTLVHYIGRESALNLFNSLYLLSFLSIIFTAAIGIFPISISIVGVTLMPVTKNIKTFRETQVKSQTFVLSLKNLLLINGATAFALAIAVLIEALF